MVLEQRTCWKLSGTPCSTRSMQQDLLQGVLDGTANA